MLAQLAATSGEFEDKSVPQNIQARRAERLTLALDRLATSLQSASTNDIRALYQRVQSIPDFNSPDFAGVLRQTAPNLR